MPVIMVRGARSWPDRRHLVDGARLAWRSGLPRRAAGASVVSSALSNAPISPRTVTARRLAANSALCSGLSRRLGGVGQAAAPRLRARGAVARGGRRRTRSIRRRQHRAPRRAPRVCTGVSAGNGRANQCVSRRSRAPTIQSNNAITTRRGADRSAGILAGFAVTRQALRRRTFLSVGGQRRAEQGGAYMRRP